MMGKEHIDTLIEANNYASLLKQLNRFGEVKLLLQKTIPLARSTVGDSDKLTLLMRKIYAVALYLDTGATLNDRREAVTILEDTERIARRVLGGAHPFTAHIERTLRNVRAVLRARKTPSPGSA